MAHHRPRDRVSGEGRADLSYRDRKDGSRCDGLSTALFVMGREKSVSFWRERRDFEMILVTDNGKILISPGLSGVFEPEKGSSYSVEVVGND